MNRRTPCWQIEVEWGYLAASVEPADLFAPTAPALKRRRSTVVVPARSSSAAVDRVLRYGGFQGYTHARVLSSTPAGPGGGR